MVIVVVGIFTGLSDINSVAVDTPAEVPLKIENMSEEEIRLRY